jgi:hypothetical protein
MGISWSAVCSAALQRPLKEQLIATRAFFGVLAAFMLATAAFAGYHLYQFCLLNESDQSRVWNRYRMFSSLVAVGGALGAVAWLTYMESLNANFQAQEFFRSGKDFALQTTQEFGRTYLWLGVHHFFEPLTFGCLTISKFLVLDRMLKFNSKSSSTDQAISQLERFVTISLRALLFFNLSVLVASWTSMALWLESYKLQSILADQYAKNVPNPDALPVQEMTARARRSAVAVHAAELIVLLVLALSFIIFGILSIARLTQFGQKLTSVSVCETTATSTTAKMISHASQLHRSLWLRIVCTVVSVFCSFVLRCVYNAMYVTSHQASINPECSNFGNCAECQDKLFIISNWLSPVPPSLHHPAPHPCLLCRMDFTPEFVASITLVSEPVTMLIALWAMTTHTQYGAARRSSAAGVQIQ